MLCLYQLSDKSLLHFLVLKGASSPSLMSQFLWNMNCSARGHLKEQIMHYIGDGSRFGVKVDYAIEPEGIFLGSARGVKLATHLLTDTFLVLQGDAYTTIDLAKALAFHRQSKADATIILKEVSDPWLYGVVVCDSNGRISAFQEKPQKGQERSNLVSTGIYCLELDVLDLITSGECDFAKDIFPRLLNEGRRLFGFVITRAGRLELGSKITKKLTYLESSLIDRNMSRATMS